MKKSLSSRLSNLLHHGFFWFFILVLIVTQWGAGSIETTLKTAVTLLVLLVISQNISALLMIPSWIIQVFMWLPEAHKIIMRKAPLSAKFGILVILANAIIAIFAPALAPYGESQIVGDQFEVWGDPFILGTDNLGRDMLTRLFYGARNTIGIAFLATGLAFFMGSLLGLLAASLGGWVDQILSRIVDIFMSIPSLIFALLVLTILGTELVYVVGVIAVLYASPVYRLARAVGMNVVVLDFVEVAKLRGEGLWWIITREVLPNSLPPLSAEFGLRFCFVFLFLSALSFLGLGIQPPLADWGSMVRDNATLITYGDITPLLPAASIALLTVAVNFVVDWFLYLTSGLRDEH